MEMWKEPLTIVDLLDRNVTDFPKREALISASYLSGEEIRFTWEEFDGTSNRWAQALRALGIKSGDKVALLMGNCSECYLCYMAVLKLGAIMVPINVRLADRELQQILAHSEAGYLVAGDSFIGSIQRIASQLPSLKKTIILAKDGDLIPVWAVSIQALLAGKKSTRINTRLSSDQISDLIYTTGTTGTPKGCILVHGGKVACGRMIGVSLGFRRLWVGWDRCQHPFPFFTSSGVSSMFMPWLYYGYTTIMEQTFDVEKTFLTMEREKSTVYLAAPSMFRLLMDDPRIDKFDLSSIKTFGYGGSAMPEELMAQVNNKWAGIRLYQVYGLTEGGTGGLTCLPADAMRKFGSIGLPWGPDQEVRIVDENDMDVHPGEVGEIILRGPNIMQGYYKDEEATRDVLRNGWLHTGDLGRFDSEGYVYFVERQKDMIVRGGFNVYATEVENVLYEHMAVAKCAVIGKPHRVLGEDVMAIVVLKPGAETNAKELMDFCTNKLADFKRPRVIEFRESLPFNAMGKLDKKLLRISIEAND